MKLILPLLVASLLFSCKPKSQESEERPPQTAMAPDTATSLPDDFDALISQFESPGREAWQQPGLILDYLGDLSGKKVADIGAGTGYFSFRIAQEAELVFAIDIDQRFIDYIEEQKVGLRNGLGQNVITQLGRADDPMLHEDEVDIVLLVNTYPLIADRVGYFRKVKQGLKSGGTLLIVDFKPEKLPVGPSAEDKLPASQVKTEIEKAGFRVVKIDESLPYQYIVKAVKK